MGHDLLVRRDRTPDRLGWTTLLHQDGICIALGNYHNVDAKRGKLGPEYVDLRDFHNVVKWFVELARSRRCYSGRNDALEARMRDIEKTYKQLLEASRAAPR